VLKAAEHQDEVDFTCCTLPFGTVSVRVSMPRTAFQMGEIMDTSISVFNRSRKALSNCSVQLVLKAQFEAMSRYEHINEKRLSENVVEQCELGKVKARCNTSFDNCLRIPESAPPSQSGIIALSYVYRFLAFPGIELEIPLVVTAMAYRSGHGQQTQYVDNAESLLEHEPGSIVYLC